MTTNGSFSDRETGEAFQWLTEPDSIQVRMLEDAMRNYNDPAYDPADVAAHLARALRAPLGGYKGDASKVQMIPLAVAVIDHTVTNGWDIVIEAGDPAG